MKFFYIVHTENDHPKHRKKIGITTVPISHRLKAYRTSDVQVKYYKVYSFTNITQDDLIQIEKACLCATRKWALYVDEYPNNECRYVNDIRELDNVCLSVFNKMGYTYTEANVDEELQKSLSDSKNDTDLVNYPFFKNATELIKYKIPQQLPNLRDFQIGVYDDMVSYYEAGARRVNLEILCRCGKTVICQHFAKKYDNDFDIIIYVTNRLALISDMIKRWRLLFPERKQLELSSSDSDYTVKEDTFKRYISKKSRMLLFTCDKSFYRLKHVLKSNRKILFVFDEAHHLCIEKTDQHPFALMDKYTHNSQNWFSIFMSGTPKIGPTNGSSYVMNDTKYFSKREHVCTFMDINRAMTYDKPFICDAKFVIGSRVKLDNIEHSESKIELQRHKQCIQILRSLMEEKELPYKPRKILMYANSTKSVDALCALLGEDDVLNQMEIYSMHSNCANAKKANRSKYLRKYLNSESGIMVNCQMLCDGIDDSRIDTVVITEPKHTKTNIIQCILRCRGYIPGKTAYVILPIIDENSAEEYKTVFEVIKMLYQMKDSNVYVSGGEHRESKLTASISNSMFVKSLMNDDVCHKILNMINGEIVYKECKSPDEAIIKILSDTSYITCTEIWNKIRDYQLWKYDTYETCQLTCQQLVKRGSIRCDNNELYYSSSQIKYVLSTTEFIELLREQKILTERKYRETYHDMYDDVYTILPEETYHKFSWNSFGSNYYTYKECRQRIYELLTPDVLEKIICQQISANKLSILIQLDNRIPPDPQKIYKLSSLFDLHHILLSNADSL